jgi:hypothetical protein
MKTVDELKKDYDAKLESLKKEKIEAIKKAKETALKKAAAERKAKRKMENHLKILIGGYVISAKKTDIIKALLGTKLNDKDKKLVESLLK